MLNIEDRKGERPKFGLFNLGFRPFFFGAGLSGVVLMTLWMGLYQFQWTLLPAHMPSIQWHAHEMIFGYALAAIAGFLLTASKNWTGVQTLHGTPLALLFILWIAARILFFFDLLMITAIVDNLFVLGVVAGVTYPIVKAKQWNQLGLIVKLVLLLVANILFYLGISGILESGYHTGLYLGLYLILAIIFEMGRRVIGFFIEKGVDETIQLKNWRWVDLSSMSIFLLFTLFDLFLSFPNITAALALGLAIVHSVRLYGWYTPGIWQKPLLWSLYIAYMFIIFGFALKASTVWFGVSYVLAIHAFTVGGVGMITMGMMARVALGHTGRSVFDPPKSLTIFFILLLAAAVVRVILPLFSIGDYAMLMLISQGLWVAAFTLFTLVYAPMLFTRRIDGGPG
ncbi:MAG: NnrS family protein [Chromatiales bacterium]|nr:NnrS family protein [Chromatiales bacterium]